MFNDLLDLLKTEYAAARDIHIHNETSTRRRDMVGLYNLRDTLDHAVKVLSALFEDENVRKAEDNLAHMREHLCRAINEGAESAAEFHVARLEEKRLPQFLYKITLTNAPSDKEIEETLETIWHHIEAGRKGKPQRGQTPNSWLDSVKEFKQAEDIAKGLSNDIPPKREVKSRLVAGIISVVGISLGILGLLVAI